MNILVLSEGNPETRDSWSGISKSIIAALRERGHVVHGGDVELTGLERWLAAAVTFATKRRRWSVRFRVGRLPFALRSSRATRLIRRHRGAVDVVLQVGGTFDAGRTAVPFAVLCDSNIRLSQSGAASGHSEASLLTPSEIAAVATREAGVYARATAIFTLSERTRRSFLDDFGIQPDRVVTMHAGPNFESLPGDVRAGNPGAPTILFIGREFRRKGGDVLLDAFRRVRAELPDAQLLVVGPQQPVAEGEGITFLGFLNKDTPEGWAALQAAYRRADVFCLPTRFEPFGIVFVEAMHFGLPCIGTRVNAVSEIIVDGETGFVVPPDDAAALAERLLTVLRDRGRAQRMGSAGKERAQRLFTWSAVAEKILRSLDSGSGAPAPRRATAASA